MGGYALSSALDEIYGLGFAYSDGGDAKYEAVTLEDIRRITKKYLPADKMVISVVQPGK